MATAIVLPQPKGTYTIIRTNGRVESFTEKPILRRLLPMLGCDTIDTVILTRRNGQAETVMMCDDTGMIDGKPVNPIATELYRSRCKPETWWSIHGDVAIVHDKDFS